MQKLIVYLSLLVMATMFTGCNSKDISTNERASWLVHYDGIDYEERDCIAKVVDEPKPRKDTFYKYAKRTCEKEGKVITKFSVVRYGKYGGNQDDYHFECRPEE